MSDFSNVNRRRFLELASKGAASGLVFNSLISAKPLRAANFEPRPQIAGPVPPTDGVYDTIVLGAGFAGITAGRNLQTYQRSVLVLEGHTRIGGRVYTMNDAIGPVELGGEFIHRAPDSVPLWREINHYNLTTQEIPKLRESLIYHPDFLNLPFTGQLRDPIFAALRSGPIRTAMMFNEIDQYQGQDKTPLEWIQQYSRLQGDFASMILTGHMPGTMRDLSVLGFQFDRISEQLLESKEYYVTAGYGSLLNSMAQGLAIETGHLIEKLEYKDGLVHVTAQVDGGIRVYKARTVVCTFSIGMLRYLAFENPNFFAKPLSAPTLGALRCLRAGFHSKMLLVFNERFWPEAMAMAHNPSSDRQAGRSYFRLFYGDEQKPALMALMMSEDAMKLDSLTEDQCLELIFRDLETMFRVDPRSHFRYGRRYRWMYDDLLARGGNSYLSTDWDLGNPVWNARAVLADARYSAPLFLAGEATAVETQPASVHGAHTSGARAALQVLQYLQDGLIPSLPATNRLILGGA